MYECVAHKVFLCAYIDSLIIIMLSVNSFVGLSMYSFLYLACLLIMWVVLCC